MLSPVLIARIIHFLSELCTFIFLCVWTPALAYGKRRWHWFALQHCHRKPSLKSQSDWEPYPNRVRFPRQSKQSFVPQLAHQISQQHQPGSPHPCPGLAVCSPGPPAPASWACRAAAPRQKAAGPAPCAFETGAAGTLQREGHQETKLVAAPFTPPSGSAASRPGENHTWSIWTQMFSRWCCPRR